MTKAQQEKSRLKPCVLGLFTLFLFKVGVLLALGLIPRSDAGGSSIGTITIPWSLYASVYYLAPIVLNYCLSLLVLRDRKQRIALIVCSVVATLFLYVVFGPDLLRRNYFGKF